ncbi:MAG: hypothetical protein HY789_06920 [Deltaproteobacteria bacterium]|nr:hypothetical protein [Deltaproteobacteria bacterium]
MKPALTCLLPLASCLLPAALQTMKTSIMPDFFARLGGKICLPLIFMIFMMEHDHDEAHLKSCVTKKTNFSPRRI